MFIRFAERGTAVFHDLCVIVRVVDETSTSLTITHKSENTANKPDMSKHVLIC
jgi:hypothetical protein